MRETQTCRVGYEGNIQGTVVAEVAKVVTAPV